ncbi:nucleotidyl transferase AbiEii/AbiGii toxin family protein [Candidatus Marsarchaeota archaeon]|nr:nucleotidyl transferase AbiEii/AbiGii toxin family protein [Candidatus Marsarchaeota archaeon]
MPAITIEKSPGLKVEQKLCAQVQDVIINLLFGNNGLPDAVLHGGSQIWRCYGSGRFSCDVDIYSQMADTQTILIPAFKREGLEVAKFKDTGNVVFARLTAIIDGKEHSSGFEIRRTPVEGVISTYTNVDGSTIDIVSISPSAIALEKIAAYMDRAEIRDMYDLHFIIKNVIGEKNVSPLLSGQLSDMLSTLQRPINEVDLAKRVYSRRAPTFDDMAAELRNVARQK